MNTSINNKTYILIYIYIYIGSLHNNNTFQLNPCRRVKRFTKQACRENVVASFFPLEIYIYIYIYIYILVRIRCGGNKVKLS